MYHLSKLPSETTVLNLAPQEAHSTPSG